MKKLKGDIIDKEITAEEFIKMYENGDFFELRDEIDLKKMEASVESSKEVKSVPLSAAILNDLTSKKITDDEFMKTCEN